MTLITRPYGNTATDITGARLFAETTLPQTLTGLTAGSYMIGRIAWSEAATVTANALATPTNTVLPAIAGTLQVTQTLTASTGTWTGSPTGYTYQWRRDGVAISGATASTYVIVAADQTRVITVTVTATNAGGSASATSLGTNAIGAAPIPAPVNTVLPVISGTAQVGQTLTSTTGTWDNGPGGFDYAWRRDGDLVPDTNSNTYVLTEDDLGAVISVTVTLTNGTGSGFATSIATVAVVAAADWSFSIGDATFTVLTSPPAPSAPVVTETGDATFTVISGA